MLVFLVVFCALEIRADYCCKERQHHLVAQSAHNDEVDGVNSPVLAQWAQVLEHRIAPPVSLSGDNPVDRVHGHIYIVKPKPDRLKHFTLVSLRKFVFKDNLSIHVDK